MRLENAQQLQKLIPLRDMAQNEPLLLTARIEVEDGERTAPSGAPFRRVVLFDSSGNVPAFALSRNWDGHNLRTLDLRCVSLEIMDANRGQRVVVIYPEYGEPLPQRHPFELLPMHRAVEPDRLARLVRLVEEFTTPSYRDFAAQVFEDPGFTVRFVTQAASRNCHHAYAGGLLAHSVELAEALMAAGTALQLPAVQVEAGVLLALFHDVGRILLNEPGSGVQLPVAGHEELIEHVLLEPLVSLRKADPDAYHAFWVLLIAYRTRDTYRAPMAGLVRGLDGCSAQADALRRTTHIGTRGQRHRLCGGREVWVLPPSRRTPPRLTRP